MAVLRYGTDLEVHLELADGADVQHYDLPSGQPLDDSRTAVALALSEPLDYPPLARCAAPGDRVVLALDRNLPQAAQVIAVVVQSLLEAGVSVDGITILHSPKDISIDAEDPRSLLPKTLSEEIPLVSHDPADRRTLAYLAANDAGEPILIHRALHEADLVLPIGCLHGDRTPGYYGIHSAVYPAFSDAKTLARFRSHEAWDGHGDRHRQLAGESAQVAWLLGINFTIQIVPAGAERIMHVVAGQSDAVRRRGRQLYRDIWSGLAARQASLVIAAIEGGPGEQTWENLGRALVKAVALAEDGGSVAVCCDLAADPGPGMQQLAGARSRAAVLRRIGKDPPEDALPTAQLVRALDHGNVYLLSRLAPSLLEELDVIPVASGDELVRLARHHKSCILLANAPRTLVRVQE
jgi:nickel-dependent lactate racemase